MRRSAFVIIVAALAVTVVAHSRAAQQTLQVGLPGQTTAQWMQRATDEYKAGRLRSAEAASDQVITALQALPSLDAVQSTMLLGALELRSRIRSAQRNPNGAREDFKTILTKWPSHTYGSATSELGVVNPEAQGQFDEVRKEVVGILVLNVLPADAEVLLDGTVIPPQERAAGQQRLLIAGQHTLLAQRAGYDKKEEAITVGPGTVVTIDWTLPRVTSRIEVITSPPGVEVYLDGVLRGKTPTGPPPRKYVSAPDVAALGPSSEVSGALDVSDVKRGSHRWELKLDCYVTIEERGEYDPPGDFYVAKKLVEASSLLRIEGTGGKVFIDGVQKGAMPYTEKLCPKPQPQRIEIRTERGRQFHTVTPIAGRPITIQANPKPAIAVMSQVGLSQAFREDLRRELELALAPAERLTFFAANADVVQKELAANGLEPGWLSFDITGRPMAVAAQMSKERRLSISNTLARSLEVQGVAELNVPEPREPRTIVLSYLAAGSNAADTMVIKLDDPQSVKAAVALLNSTYSTSRISSGLEVADIAGVSGAVVLRQVWSLTNNVAMNPGDVIESVDGRKIEDGSAFEHAVASRKPGDKLQLQVKGIDGPTKTVTLAPATFSLVVSPYDETLTVNRLILDFRNKVVDAATPRDEAIARLNLAVLLIRAGNWSEAKTELDRVDLPDLQGGGQAVSRGTVQYYLGLCFEALDRRAEAAKAFQAAAASPGALLTGDDNTLVKPLAEEKLKARR